MSENMGPLELEEGMLVTLRLRATDTLVDGHLTELQDGHLLISYEHPARPLRRSEFDLGVDVEVLEERGRFASEEVAVTQFDSDQKQVTIQHGPQLPFASMRANQRERIETEARLVFKTETFEGTTIEIGGGGASFEMAATVGYPAGTPVTFVLELDGEEVSGPARLSWVGGGKLGIAFEELPPPVYSKIYQAIYTLQRERRARQRQLAG